MPSRRTIICYECGYEHTVTGALHNSFCPKCRKKLETGDKQIQGPTAEAVRTIGSIEILPDALLEAVDIVGDRIRIAGDVRQATLRATTLIEILEGAKLDVGRLETDKLSVPAQNRVELTQPIQCQNLEISGTLLAQVTATGSVCIRPGGVLDGTLTCSSLVVEDGGGLRADVKLRP